MTDTPRRPQWWLMGVAAVLAALFLYESIGTMGVAALSVAAIVGYAVYRLRRGRSRTKGPMVRCLTCGETLPSTARQCKYCGSASWTVIN
jgi:hypothetical protein